MLTSLPTSPDDVSDHTTFVEAIEKLTMHIETAITTGSNTSRINKAAVLAAADEINRLSKLYTSSNPTPAPALDAPPTEKVQNIDLLGDMKKDLIKEIRQEVRQEIRLEIAKLRQDPKTKDVQPAEDNTITYASMAKRPGHAHAAPGPPINKAPARIVVTQPPVTRPAIIITTKSHTNSRQEAVDAFRQSISFKKLAYGPARVTPVSKGKIRVEFDKPEDRDDALKRLNTDNDSKVKAEVATRLKPMAILKGIAKETTKEELIEVILGQNQELGEYNQNDISLKFIRDNRNTALYNAVIITSPRAFRTLMGMERVRVDYQRVHIEEFSPFLQCLSCLQFGHTKAHCKTPTARCAHCAQGDHSHTDCQAKDSTPKCYNCTTHNTRFENKYPTDHKATSNTCPILRAMRNKTNNNIDYGFTA